MPVLLRPYLAYPARKRFIYTPVQLAGIFRFYLFACTVGSFDNVFFRGLL